MLPGKPCIHAVLGLKDTLLRGGFYWDLYRLDDILKMLHKIFKKPHITNEQIPNEITLVIDNLHRNLDQLYADFIPKEHPEDKERVRSSLEQLKKLVLKKICCNCKNDGSCGKNAECKCVRKYASQNNLSKSEGCTSWCTCKNMPTCGA
jgi:hypothetical protein